MTRVGEVLTLVVLAAWAAINTLTNAAPLQHPLPPIVQLALDKVGQRTGGGDVADGSSLWQTVFKLDQLLQRPNEYNTPMWESGEEDDQLSRLLYEVQENSLDGNTDLTEETLLRYPRNTKKSLAKRDNRETQLSNEEEEEGKITDVTSNESREDRQKRMARRKSHEVSRSSSNNFNM
ncbi:hypothetical protein Hamer_G022121 [Homarus americanus]|uniref:Uncharacterized protein n=1 Tax=Homarus americanus TaxID=6706 RepID=A0A8J5MK85_HOMAM|nr:hypothetical protein Hamer_G022121 [Homarus americanus]